MKKHLTLLMAVVIFIKTAGISQGIRTNYVNSFENVNHPEVAYWFFTASMMVEKNYKEKIDHFVKDGKYTLIFLTERDSCDFYDIKAMHPVFKNLVAYAHQKGLKIGLQIWKRDRAVRIENTDRLIQEGEVQLDENGAAAYSVKARGAREMNTLLKSELFRVYAFKKSKDGFYDPATLKDITTSANARATANEVTLALHAGKAFKGYTAYIMTQHYYNSCSNFSGQAKSILLNAFRAYGDIPFNAIGLDEYKNMKIAREKILDSTHESFRERVYSLGMAQKLKAGTGVEAGRLLFDMRYAPNGKPAVRVRAINGYMALLRTATLGVEAAMYDLGKKMYGKNVFIGLHNTFHNNLDRDEVWQTGVSWWNIKRDYGHTDENTITPIQLGIGMSYPKNALYNMFYDKSLERIWTKALYDLRYGVRTHYHAANDVDGWGVSIDAPQALLKINKVENAARLLNRFNPSFPKAKLLVIYGMEALYNWYPNTQDRGLYDINDKLGFEKKSMQLWLNNYLPAAVPTDLIADGRLQLNAAGKPVLHGYVFDAIVFLAPQYARKSTTDFIKHYLAKGGKLLLDGKATMDFYGNDITNEWKAIENKAVATSFSLENIAKLGIAQNKLADGVPNEDGSYTFTNMESLKTGKPAVFSFTDHGNTFSGVYKGLAAIQVDEKGRLLKLAATAFVSLSRNGRQLLHLDKEADIFFSLQQGKPVVTIADPERSIKVYADEK